MSNVRLIKDLKKKVQNDNKKNDNGWHRNLSDHFEASFCCNRCNRWGSFVCLPAHQHVLAVPLIF